MTACPADRLQKVDIIYIGTRHMTHYDDTKLALNAGKHVLLEKVGRLTAELTFVACNSQRRRVQGLDQARSVQEPLLHGR